MWETARYATRPALTTSSMRLAHPLFVTRSIDIARTRMLELLARLADEAERERFLAASLAIGAVTACADRDGARGWVPTPKTDSLYDRLQTLLAADLLNGPRVCDASAPLRHL